MHIEILQINFWKKVTVQNKKRKMLHNFAQRDYEYKEQGYMWLQSEKYVGPVKCLEEEWKQLFGLRAYRFRLMIEVISDFCLEWVRWIVVVRKHDETFRFIEYHGIKLRKIFDRKKLVSCNTVFEKG